MKREREEEEGKKELPSGRTIWKFLAIVPDALVINRFLARSRYILPYSLPVRARHPGGFFKDFKHNDDGDVEKSQHTTRQKK